MVRRTVHGNNRAVLGDSTAQSNRAAPRNHADRETPRPPLEAMGSYRVESSAEAACGR